MAIACLTLSGRSRVNRPGRDGTDHAASPTVTVTRLPKARHHVGPRIAGHAVRGGEHHAPDSSVGMTVPHGEQGHDPDAVRAAVAHERGDHFGVEPRRARYATSATCKPH